LIRLDDTPQTLAQRVNEKERVIQSIFLNLVVMGYITYPDPDYRTLVIDEKIWGFYKQFANIPGQKYEIKKYPPYFI
jgi:hypothetical protein